MSPEQVRGEELDARTDLFSFGVLLYEMATGNQAFPGPTSGVIFDGVLNRQPIEPLRLNPLLATELDRLLNKALEKDRLGPACRPPTPAARFRLGESQNLAARCRNGRYTR